jgi:16S rRNA processing protein RimM
MPSHPPKIPEPTQTTAKQDTFLAVGRLGRSHGVHGWMNLESFTEPPENILHYPHWHIKKKGLWQPMQAQSQRKGAKLLAKLDGIDTPEAARAYTQSLIAVPRSDLPDLAEDDYYWSDLMGCEVRNTEGHYLGCVKELMETGANDVLVLTHKDKLQLVPYLEHVIVRVDLNANSILVDWAYED